MEDYEEYDDWRENVEEPTCEQCLWNRRTFAGVL